MCQPAAAKLLPKPMSTSGERSGGGGATQMQQQQSAATLTDMSLASSFFAVRDGNTRSRHRLQHERLHRAEVEKRDRAEM